MLAKSKLNSVETWITQALKDLKISHEALKTITNEKKKNTKDWKNIWEWQKVMIKKMN